MDYIATFHTHFGAMTFQRKLKSLEIAGEMAPVPRKLSASCGVCVLFQTKLDVNTMDSKDLHGIYKIEQGEFQKILEHC